MNGVENLQGKDGAWINTQGFKQREFGEQTP
jgi:hypothetical protein